MTAGTGSDACAGPVEDEAAPATAPVLAVATAPPAGADDPDGAGVELVSDLLPALDACLFINSYADTLDLEYAEKLKLAPPPPPAELEPRPRARAAALATVVLPLGPAVLAAAPATRGADEVPASTV